MKIKNYDIRLPYEYVHNKTENKITQILNKKQHFIVVNKNLAYCRKC